MTSSWIQILTTPTRYFSHFWFTSSTRYLSQHPSSSSLPTKSTVSAKDLFDQGLGLYFGPNPKEGKSLFHKAAKMGSTDAMYHLGLALIDEPDPELGSSDQWLHQAAEKGHPAAQYSFGLNKNDIAWLRKSSDSGFSSASYQLGILNVDDHNTAFQYFKLATDQGHHEAPNSLGLFFELGIGSCSIDLNKAFDLYLLSSKRGSAKGTLNLGRMYSLGLATDPNPWNALVCFSNAYENNAPGSTFYLASSLLQWSASTQSAPKVDVDALSLKYPHPERFALEILENSDDPAAKCYLAQLYANGQVVGQSDPEKAFKLWSSVSDYHPAKFAVANCLQNGFGVEKDINRANQLFKELSVFSHSDTSSEINVSNSFGKQNRERNPKSNDPKDTSTRPSNEGSNNEVSRSTSTMFSQKDIAQILSYMSNLRTTQTTHTFSKLLNQYQSNPVPELAFIIGTCFCYGWGTPENIIQAKAFFESAVAFEYIPAYVPLACLYLFNSPKEQQQILREYTQTQIHTHTKPFNENGAKAIQYLYMASEHGDSRAQYFLGLACHYGLGGCEIDPENAVAWYLASHETGDCPQGSFALAVALRTGYGLNSQLESKYGPLAVEIFSDLAKNQNHVGSMVNLGSIYFFGECQQDCDLNLAIDYWISAAIQSSPQALYSLAAHVLSEKYRSESLRHAALNQFLAKYLSEHKIDCKIEPSSNLYILPNISDIQYLLYKDSIRHGNYLHSHIQLGNRALAKQDFAVALAHYEHATSLENPHIYNICGLIYMLGKHDPTGKPDMERARQYFEKSAQLENPSGLLNYGLFCRLGQGGPVDHSKAFACFEKSHSLGNPVGTWYLGVATCFGQGTKRDVDKGKEFLTLAESQGFNPNQTQHFDFGEHFPSEE